MSNVETTVQTTATEVVVKAVTKAEAQRVRRQRFYFGPVWNQAVQAGKVTDRAKLAAQADLLKVGAPAFTKSWKLETLIAKVAAKLAAQPKLNAAETSGEAATA